MTRSAGSAKTDLGGRPVDTRAELKDGTRFDGLDGLKAYLLTKRREEFRRQFCRKLLGYALGRAVQLSDEPLIDEMLRRMDQRRTGSPPRSRRSSGASRSGIIGGASSRPVREQHLDPARHRHDRYEPDAPASGFRRR